MEHVMLGIQNLAPFKKLKVKRISLLLQKKRYIVLVKFDRMKKLLKLQLILGNHLFHESKCPKHILTYALYLVII